MAGGGGSGSAIEAQRLANETGPDYRPARLGWRWVLVGLGFAPLIVFCLLSWFFN